MSRDPRTVSLFDDLPEPGPPSGRGGLAEVQPPVDPTAVPLAERMRPRCWDDIVGQEAVVGPNGFLRAAVDSDRVPSVIFWGPPGTGKTTLASLIASLTSATFVPFSAVTSGIKEIREVMGKAEGLSRQRGGRGVLVFVDEIHRFNKAQQDAFLPFVERGHIVLVGATTENPSFELNRALLSRCRVVVLEPLTTEELEQLVQRALRDPDRGLGSLGLDITPEALASLAQLAGGDARRALGSLELAAADVSARNQRAITAEDVSRTSQRTVLGFDKNGDEHYQQLSALHKSMRESDPDASAYWLLRMLEAGESPAVLARRMLRFAAEDVGLADPDAVGRALAAWQGFDRLGHPEGELLLVQAAIDLALAPKSVAVYQAEKAVRRSIAEQPAEPVPMALRNAPTDLMSKVGFGAGYVYAPESEHGVAGLQCLPDGLREQRFYRPSEQGAEQRLGQRLAELEDLRRRARGETDPGTD